jgi:hypothetical protein
VDADANIPTILQEIKKRNLYDEIIAIKELITAAPVPVPETVQGTMKKIIRQTMLWITERDI